MGMTYAIVCHKCKIARDLDKIRSCFSTCESREDALALSSSGVGDFREILLSTFIGLHRGHNIELVDEEKDFDLNYPYDYNFWNDPDFEDHNAERRKEGPSGPPVPFEDRYNTSELLYKARQYDLLKEGENTIVSKALLASLQKDSSDYLKLTNIFKANVLKPFTDFIRAAPDCVCPVCSKKFITHPQVGYLHRLCDGQYVKL